ncbi:MAG: vWA domain-containing protein [Planctomycetota bacterium]|jgi:Mg-chelatase subunit ChlD
MKIHRWMPAVAALFALACSSAAAPQDGADGNRKGTDTASPVTEEAPEGISLASPITFGGHGHPDTIREKDPVPVDLVIALDISGSMNGLVDAARTKLWEIVNDLGMANPTPRLRVAVVTFGSGSHEAAAGWTKVQTDLTEDLDLVSERLFALKTGGSKEYVGRALRVSLDSLTWSPEKGSLQLIVVAGNESADQDREVPVAEEAKRCISRGIMINTIFCGNPADGVAPTWKDVAKLADGHFASIDHDNGTVVVETPFDARLTELGTAMNGTYCAFGKKGQWYASNQVIQDDNANGSNSQTAASRAVMKGSSNYRNSHWDLVDAAQQEDFDLSKVEEKDLPEALRKMTLEERKAHLDKLRTERKRISTEIARLNEKRVAYIDAEMKKAAKDPSKSFDFAVRKAGREQAGARGFTFGREEAKIETTESR